jgi:hypothetical protein
VSCVRVLAVRSNTSTEVSPLLARAAVSKTDGLLPRPSSCVRLFRRCPLLSRVPAPGTTTQVWCWCATVVRCRRRPGGVGVRRNTVILASHVCESAFPRPRFTSAALHDDIRASKMSCSSSSRLGSSSSRLDELRVHVPHRACRRSKPSHRSGHRNYSHLRVLRRRV